uniref:lisH domain-containing protein ARMC9 n=1 Tax=Myxine glutinosa TaxID=7769 RepID=UPI00358FFAE0
MADCMTYEAELNEIVGEYLHVNGYEATLCSLQAENEEKGQPPLEVVHHSGLFFNGKKDLLLAYSSGDWATFFSIWNTLISNLIDSDTAVQQLEFYLQIHFAILPLRTATEVEDCAGITMKRFKFYLATHGAELSHHPELLPFFALPSVQNPSSHPTFQKLFTNSWMCELRTKLKTLLEKFEKCPSNESRLLVLYKTMKQTKQTKRGSLCERGSLGSGTDHETQCRRYGQLLANYQTLLGITADLVDSLEGALRGRPVSPDFIEGICSRFLGPNYSGFEMCRPGSAAECIRASIASMSLEKEPADISLDIKRLKEDLVGSEECQRVLLLQALRWRLLRATFGQPRDAVLHEYIFHDLLDCNSEVSFMEGFLGCSSSRTRQATVRLLNSIAAQHLGQSYLARSPALLGAIVKTVKSEEDALIREPALGVLQKLSLIRSIQSFLIGADIIRWLLDILHQIDADGDGRSVYMQEVAASLFMNLCKCTAGKRACVDNARSVLRILTDLLSHDVPDLWQYINGALYNLLSLPALREEARAIVRAITVQNVKGLICLGQDLMDVFEL